MNNEYNNDKTDNGYYTERNQFNNNDQYNNDQLNSYGQNQNNQFANQSQYVSAYSTPQLKQNGEKPKKKRGFLGALKLTAAAVAFGLIAGIVFQGYYYVTQPEDTEIVENNNNNEILLAEETVGGDTSIDEASVVPISSSSETVITDVSGVVENVMPSIVAINSSATITNYDIFGREFSEPVEGSGSGIIIGQNGSELLIVTNNHVIESATEVEIVFTDENTAKATIKGTDARADLAVLSVNLNDLSEETASAIKVATLGNSEELKAGEMAIAIGNALGYGQSVTVGYISAVNREVLIDNKTMTLLQTDAAINPGNSGGALMNSAGEVIGINSVKYASSSVEGMGYAIPISDAIPIINELMSRETIAEAEQGFLGIYKESAENVTEAYANRLNMPIGVYVNDVVPESPAEVAGLKKGYIIVGVDDKIVETIDDLLEILSYSKAGENITLVVSFRGDNGSFIEKDLFVTLGSR